MKEERVRESYDRLLAIRASGEVDRTSCLSPEALQELLQPEISEQERLRRIDHIMGCPFCLPEFELLRSVAKAEPPRPFPRVTALAAALTLLLGAALVWRLGSPRDGSVLRGDGAPIAIESPAPDARVVPPASFVWHPVADALQYRIEVLTPSGDVVWQHTGTDTTATMSSDTPLPSGAEYRWAVVAEITNGEHVRSTLQRFKVVAP
ncbi:MAG TPA: hypothetical protein VH438_01030 [Gemmatimonadales bacterium]|jgi:hypothetical protein